MKVDGPFCCALSKSGYKTLTRLYRDSYYEEVKLFIIHCLHEDCKGCWREKMLKLKPKYKHTCDQFDGNLIEAYNKYGLQCMKEVSENVGARWKIASRFGESRRDLSFWLPHIDFISFNSKEVKQLNRSVELRVNEESKSFKMKYDRKCTLCYNVRNELNSSDSD